MSEKVHYSMIYLDIQSSFSPKFPLKCSHEGLNREFSIHKAEAKQNEKAKKIHIQLICSMFEFIFPDLLARFLLPTFQSTTFDLQTKYVITSALMLSSINWGANDAENCN